MKLPDCVYDFPPRAPSMAEWEALTPAERLAVVEALPTTFTEAELSPPEGDPHRIACALIGDSLRGHWERLKRNVYVGSDLAVYYPAAQRFAPDLFVVFDVPPGERDRWVVAAEGKGLDFVLEVTYRGDRRKDLVENVHRYASLGIPEYFVYDRGAQRIHGFQQTAAGGKYVPIVPQRGFWPSAVLGLDLTVEDGSLRFYLGTARIAAPGELLTRLQRVVEEKERLLDEKEAALQAEASRAEEEQRLREEEQRLREEEQRLREEEQRLRSAAEDRVAELLARLAELERTR